MICPECGNESTPDEVGLCSFCKSNMSTKSVVETETKPVSKPKTRTKSL